VRRRKDFSTSSGKGHRVKVGSAKEGKFLAISEKNEQAGAERKDVLFRKRAKQTHMAKEEVLAGEGKSCFKEKEL